MTRLTRKEKSLAVTVIILAVLWTLFTFVVKPALARVETLNRVLPEKQNELEKLRLRGKKYVFFRDGLQDFRAKVASQDQTFDLLPFLESLIQKCGLAKNAIAMNRNVLQLDPDYQDTIVEIKLENLTLRQLVDLLIRIETSSQVLAKTKSLYIKRNPANADLLDSVIEIHSPKLAQSQVARR